MTTPTPKSLDEALAARKAAGPTKDPATVEALDKLLERVIAEAEIYQKEIDELADIYKRGVDLREKADTKPEEVEELRKEFAGEPHPVPRRGRQPRPATDRPHVPVKQRLNGWIERAGGGNKFEKKS